MSLLKSDSNEGILTVSFVPDKILDALMIQQIQGEMTTILETAAAENVLLDFRGVKYLSSAALGMLVRAYQKCKASKMNLKLCNLIPDICEIFKITGIDRMLDIQPDAEAAERAFLQKRR